MQARLVLLLVLAGWIPVSKSWRINFNNQVETDEKVDVSDEPPTSSQMFSLN